MTASEFHTKRIGKTIERLESVMRIVQGETHKGDLRAAIEALRACEKIRELIEREGREASAAKIEELLP